MKRLLALFLSFCVLFSVTGCGIDQETLNIIEDVVEIAGDIADELDSAAYPEENSGNEEEISTDDPDEETLYTQSDEASTEPATEPSNDDLINNASSSDEKQVSSGDNSSNDKREEPEKLLDKSGTYTSVDDVALYIYLYKELPKNFITKAEANKLGWKGGGLEKFAPGKCIGGDRFGNYEGLLPEKKGRKYTECDIDTLGKNSRGSKRIVFSNDGLIFYTEDHYSSFKQLYDENGRVE